MNRLPNQPKLEAFKETFAPPGNFIYYPFCGGDYSPWNVFDPNKVLGTDINETRSMPIREFGTVVIADASEYIPPQSPDVLLLLGWRWDKTMPNMACTVADKGYIVTNSFFAAGGILGRLQDKGLKLVGQIKADSTVETQRVAGGEITPLGTLQYIAERHTTHTDIAQISLEAELVRPEWYAGSLLVMQWQSE